MTAPTYPAEVVEQVARALVKWQGYGDQMQDFGDARDLAVAALTASPLAAVTAERDEAMKLLRAIAEADTNDAATQAIEAIDDFLSALAGAEDGEETKP